MDSLYLVRLLVGDKLIYEAPNFRIRCNVTWCLATQVPQVPQVDRGRQIQEQHVHDFEIADFGSKVKGGTTRAPSILVHDFSSAVLK